MVLGTKGRDPMTRKTKGGPSGPSGRPLTYAEHRAKGQRQLCVWLDAETWAALEAWAAANHPSRTAAVASAINYVVSAGLK